MPHMICVTGRPTITGRFRPVACCRPLQNFPPLADMADMRRIVVKISCEMNVDWGSSVATEAELETELMFVDDTAGPA